MEMSTKANLKMINLRDKELYGNRMVLLQKDNGKTIWQMDFVYILTKMVIDTRVR